jgi:ferric-dicitrate binding protein FerR (iron transport regulator)
MFFGRTGFAGKLKATALCAGILFTLTALSGFSQTGRVTYLLGDATVTRGDNSFSARIGTTLEQRDVVRTGPSATMIIQLSQRSTLKLRADTTVRMSDMGSEPEVRLDSGGLFAQVAERLRGRFEVRTPSVVAGVRGTQFFVAYGRTVEEKPDLWLCVNEGRVEVRVRETGESSIVREGEGINILASSRLTDPQFYQWTTRLNWNMNPDEGSVEDDTSLDDAYSDLLDQDYD